MMSDEQCQAQDAGHVGELNPFAFGQFAIIAKWKRP